MSSTSASTPSAAPSTAALSDLHPGRNASPKVAPVVAPEIASASAPSSAPVVNTSTVEGPTEEDGGNGGQNGNGGDGSGAEPDQDVMSKFNLRKGLYQWRSFGSLEELIKDGDVLERPHEHESYNECSERSENLWRLMPNYLPTDVHFIQRHIANHVEYTLARTRFSFDYFTAYQAASYSVRDRLIESWNDTQQYFKDRKPRTVYYLSLEFLLGRSLRNSIFNLGLQHQYALALREMGYSLESCFDEERDAALGNGGLGRLAACFMDSLATLNLPAWGYGIRYKYGMFKQKIRDGYQVERPDYWLTLGNPWEIERPDVYYPVQFYGQVVDYVDAEGRPRKRWEGGEIVFAVAFDSPIPGFQTCNTLNIRLWSAKPAMEFDFESFNRGNYFKAVQKKQQSENLTSVLYPNDDTYLGKELRLKQQYFFVCATIKDIVRRFKNRFGSTPAVFKSHFAEKVAIQLNDTHPSVGVAELMRVLQDEEGLLWEEAWAVTRETFNFTNHTVLPEALEKWSVPLFQSLLPRHMEIIFDINFRLMEGVRERFQGDVNRMRAISIIEEGNPKMVRMAHLAIAGSKFVNGVAAIHSDILRQHVFADHVAFFGSDKFQSVTNGVTPRRWLCEANPGLADLISDYLGSHDWVQQSDLLTGLRRFVEDPDLQTRWWYVKMENKERLAQFVRRRCGVQISVDALFDVHIKRFHEYKRQLLNILGVIYRYYFLKKVDSQTRAKIVKKVVIFAGKAAPGYDMAKRIIKLINSVAQVVNSDPVIGDALKVVFIADYNVSCAEVIVPGTDLSQHISTAGTEASGTSNMKFALNGGLILGTLDGANIEIHQHIGAENMFIFGATAVQVPAIRENLRNMSHVLDPKLEVVFSLIEKGTFGNVDYFMPILNSLRYGNDYYIVTADFASYIKSLQDVDRLYCNKKAWVMKSILSTAGSGWFSSDRTIREYAEKIWRIEPCARPRPQRQRGSSMSMSTTPTSSESPTVNGRRRFSSISSDDVTSGLVPSTTSPGVGGESGNPTFPSSPTSPSASQ